MPHRAIIERNQISRLDADSLRVGIYSVGSLIVFRVGLFRSWHNKRAFDPEGLCRRLTLGITCATEAHLFITDLNQSPFNVGTRLLLEDFTFEQVAELNRRYDLPLSDDAEVARFYRLVGGHPYLTQRLCHAVDGDGIVNGVPRITGEPCDEKFNPGF